MRLGMKTMTVRDLRQLLPEAEAALQIEGEILITRDAKPVARLVRISEESTRRWDPKAHARWQKKVAGGKVSRSDAALSEARSERDLRLDRSVIKMVCVNGMPATSLRVGRDRCM